MTIKAVVNTQLTPSLIMTFQSVEIGCLRLMAQANSADGPGEINRRTAFV